MAHAKEQSESIFDLIAFEIIKPGKILFRVHAFVNKCNAYVTEYIALGNVYKTEYGHLFIKAYDVENDFVTDFSLRDSGYPTNTYNDHKLFFNRSDAERYCNDVYLGKVSSRKIQQESVL